jgi:hypothetical protein
MFILAVAHLTILDFWPLFAVPAAIACLIPVEDWLKGRYCRCCKSK